MASSSTSRRPSEKFRDQVLDFRKDFELLFDNFLEFVDQAPGRQDEDIEHVDARGVKDLLDKSLAVVVNERQKTEQVEQRLVIVERERDNAVNARESCYTKNRHLRRVLRDLLAERGDLGSPRSVTQADIEEALGEDYQESSSSSSSGQSTPKSDKTVRGPQRQDPSMLFETPRSSVILLQPLPAGLKGGRSSPSHFGRASPVAGPSSTSTSSPQIQTAMVDSPNSSPGTFSIHFKGVPRTATVKEGPFHFEFLKRTLGLPAESIKALELASKSSKPFRVHITTIKDQSTGSKYTCAFLYQPILVENRQRTFLVDWGRSQDNKAVLKAITHHFRREIHTFIFAITSKGGSWKYMGAQQWSNGDLATLWPLEDDSSKQKVIKKLCEFTSDSDTGRVSEEEMVRRLDEEILKQVAIRLTEVPDNAVSRKFIRAFLTRSESTVEPKHEGLRA